MKEKYTAPHIEIIVPHESFELMAGLSIPVSNSDAGDGGDAKGGYFDDEDEEETNPNPWDEPLF